MDRDLAMFSEKAKKPNGISYSLKDRRVFSNVMIVYFLVAVGKNVSVNRFSSPLYMEIAYERLQV